ncbi:MAG: cytochrome c [Acidobacteriia bacterium]|nr:cytochrome c [Terriglobia bacterium]
MALPLLIGVGCRTDMHVQPRYRPMQPSHVFDDGRSARPLIEGTVARGHLRVDELLYTGKVNGKDSEVFPFPITQEILERGQQRFNIYCVPCHDRTGSGNGIIPQRGFRHPPSYHIDRLRQAPVGHFFDVMTNGFGAMYSFASRVSPRDRWAIAAYIRALQLSQQAGLNDVPPAEQHKLLSEGK